MSDETKCPQCGAPMPGGAPEGLCPACLLKRGLETQTAGGASAANFTPPPPEELARQFPQLEILELLGRGGMGAVYKARQRELDRFVALKILPPAADRDPAFAERFTREARALARLSHPNIVAVYDFGQTGGFFYFVMEFVDGMNLRQLLATAKITPREALAIVPQICDALQIAHDQGIVHRDIKPENILLDKKGRVKIADFGIAKIVGGDERDMTLTGAGEIVGTPAYMAPEQIEHPRDVDHRADIYSLGVVFYQMLTGELPLGKFAPPSRMVRIDVRLDDIVLRALEKQPELRYQQASEVKTQVETIAGTQGDRPRHKEPVYAGFWNRFLALFIDYTLISIAVFPFLMAVDYIAPGSVVVSVPFDLFTTEHVIDSNASNRKNDDGSTTVVDTRIKEVTILNRWKYLYREEVTHNGGNETTTSQLIDPVSQQDIDATDADDVVFWILMTYWIVMESSPWQASIGKRIVGLQVVDRYGQRLSFARAVGRNVSKIISAVTLMLGFLAAGWTRRKQALHDMMADCYVTYGRPSGAAITETERPFPISPEPVVAGAYGTSSQEGKYLAIAGAILQLGSIFSLIWMVAGVMSAFHSLSQRGVTSIQPLAAAIGHVLEASAVGLVLGVSGLVLLCIALTAQRYRARWFFWFLVIYGWPLLFLVPVGTAFGLFFLVYCLSRREEFLGAAGATGQLPQSPASAPAASRFGRLPLWLLLLGLLGTPFLLALSPRQDFGAAFGALSLLLALVFGLIEWRTRLGRGVAATVILLVIAMGVRISIMKHQAHSAMEAARSKMEADIRQAKEERDAENLTHANSASPAPNVPQSAMEQVLAEYDWTDLAAKTQITGGSVETVDGRSALKIENTTDAPLQLSLMKIENPPVTATQYALTGEIKYENVKGAGYLEMWNDYPQGNFFSRTRGEPGSGPMEQIAGTSSWRTFSLPFDCTGTASPPTRLEFNIFLPDRGTVFIGPLKLTQPMSGPVAQPPSLPRVIASPNPYVGQVVVNVRHDGSIIFNHEPLSGPELLVKLRALQKQFPDQAVIIRGDQDVDYKLIVKVLDVCRQAGIWNVAFATAPTSQPAASASPER